MATINPILSSCLLTLFKLGRLTSLMAMGGSFTSHSNPLYGLSILFVLVVFDFQARLWEISFDRRLFHLHSLSSRTSMSSSSSVWEALLCILKGKAAIELWLAAMIPYRLQLPNCFVYWGDAFCMCEGFVGAQTMPVLYEKYEDEVGGFVDSLLMKFHSHYKKMDTGFLSRIPSGRFGFKKHD
ncbi:hypothetical protein HID58_005820 [Brassica napus]|uniref:Reticulon domain-containing protein n=1 Tax=Brassica napus TaxID=3708 RepID=A0ABQ8E9M7_BRANA|nr:hypothetical protein HID58_005820 [Brassica napus]